MKARFLSRLATAALLALAGSALVLPASPAHAATTTAQAPVEYGNGDCGDPILGAPVIGSARFLRVDDRLSVRYVMTTGDATTDYDVFLFDGDTCAPLARLGSFSTDAAGAGHLTGKSVKVAGSTRFYAVARDTSNFVGIPHGSLAVDLP